MAIILNIDSAVETASVCLAIQAKLIQFAINSNQKDHASWLHPVIQKLISKTDLNLRDIEAIAITIGFVLVSKTKKQMGTMTFKEGFTVYFLAALIGTFISKIYEYILFNFIDTEAKETIKEITMKYTAEMMEKFGTPAAAVNEAMQKMAETDNYSIGNVLFGLAIGLVFQAIFGLILAAIFKSKSSQGL